VKTRCFNDIGSVVLFALFAVTAIAMAEERPNQLLTSLTSTSISGYVSTSAHWTPPLPLAVYQANITNSSGNLRYQLQLIITENGMVPQLLIYKDDHLLTSGYYGTATEIGERRIRGKLFDDGGWFRGTVNAQDGCISGRLWRRSHNSTIVRKFKLMPQVIP
jgi:hypothetical protein